jgi:nucleoside-diphosphate-sugar epimerase
MILITGINGFLAQHLLKYCLAQGEKVLGIARTAPLIEHENYTHLHEDLVHCDIEKVLPEGISKVFHLAQSSRYREVPDGMGDVYQVNVHATQRLLEWSRRSGVTHFIYASTGNVYGNTKQIYTESDPVNPHSFYAWSKVLGESLCKSYAEYMKITVFRIFGLYGDGQHNMLIPNMIDKVAKGDVINLAQGQGLYINPIYVEDACQLMMGVMENQDKNLEIINLGGPKKYHLGEIVDAIGQVLKVSPLVESNENDITFLVGDTTKLQACVPNYEYMTLENGLKHAIGE